MEPANWPPYGALSNFYLDRIAAGIVPRDWQRDVPKTEARETAWREWRDGIVDDIAGRLWPVFDTAAARWETEEPDRMRQLTEADFEVLLRIQAPGGDEWFLRPPGSPNVAPNAASHREFFRWEDGERPLGQDYALYDTHLEPRWVASVPMIAREAIDFKVGSASLQFKRVFQRPRAYQMSLLLGHREFRHEMAITSMTSSLSSGHALQGAIVGCAVFDNWWHDGPIPKTSFESLCSSPLTLVTVALWLGCTTRPTTWRHGGSP